MAPAIWFLRLFDLSSWNLAHYIKVELLAGDLRAAQLRGGWTVVENQVLTVTQADFVSSLQS